MSRPPLTRDEAAARAALLDVSAYAVELDLTTGPDTFRSVSTVTFGCRVPGAATFAELVAPAVHEIVLNGERLDPAEVLRDNRITLTGLQAVNELRVVADCAYSHTGEGLHRFTDPADGEVYTYSQTFLYDAQRVFACFDQPDLKATWDVAVKVPPGWSCVANGAAVDPPAAATGGWWRFAPTRPLSTYLTAVVAGPYEHVHETHDGIDLGLWYRRSLAPNVEPDVLFEATRQSFDHYHRAFGVRYPFGAKYDQLFVPEFNAGAMENAAAVTFREERMVFRGRVTEAEQQERTEVIAHEMAHMWFGDLVTMRWWDDLWLNESFATYASYVVLAESTRHRNAWTAFCASEKAWGYRADQLPSTHPISAEVNDTDTALTNFDGISYGKGASVLKQLAAWVGDEPFLVGLRSYFERHAFGNTTLADLLRELERASGRDLTAWADEWLRTAGVATLRAEIEADAGGTITSFAVLQEAPADHPTLRSHRIGIGLYDDGPGGVVLRDRVEVDVSGPRTEVKELAGVRRGDLVLVNDGDLAFAKLRFDPRSLETVRTRLAAVRDPLTRALCWAAVWDLTRDAELPARAYVELVLAHALAEDDTGTVQTALKNAATAVDRYVAPGAVAATRRRFAAGCRDLLAASPPGDDRQVAFARAYAGAASEPDDLAELARWLDGGAPAGLEVDRELRWLVVRQLASAGALGPAAIDAELAADHTLAGEKHAATARAARPDPAAKAAAWAAVVESDRLSNHLLVATVDGFWRPGQEELCRGYAERYFEALPSLWETRTTETAQAVARWLYPALLVEPDTVERTDAFLAHPVAAPLGRTLLEQRAELVRALAARERDAS